MATLRRALHNCTQVPVENRKDYFRSSYSVRFRVPRYKEATFAIAVVSEEDNTSASVLHCNERTQFVGKGLGLCALSSAKRIPNKVYVHN